MSIDRISFPKVLIHIGRPDESKPHRDMSLVQAFIASQKDVAIIMLVDNETDQREMEERVKNELKWPPGHPGGLIITWKDDSEVVDLLCSKMFGTLNWRVVGNGWYQCPSGHEFAATLKTPLETCETCGGKLEFIQHNKEKVDRFRYLLEKSAKLMHFDTRSGELLNQVVSPDSNALRNIPSIVGCEHAPALMLEDLKGKGKGKNALLVSAGPSLNDELDNLKRLQDSHLVLCVGRVYKLLRSHGIRVDYTFSCEMFEWDSVIFDGLNDVGDTVLCYPGVCAPATVKAWPGKKVCMMDPQLAEMLGRKLAMMGGNSVSHHMLNFACEILDVDTAILVGQDLAYTRPQITHAEGSNHEWPGEVKAQDFAAHAEIEWGPSYGKGKLHPECHKQDVFMAGNNFAPVGDVQVRTSGAYKNFGTLFEILVTRHKKKVLNACGEGLKISGVPYLNLSEWSK